MRQTVLGNLTIVDSGLLLDVLVFASVNFYFTSRLADRKFFSKNIVAGWILMLIIGMMCLSYILVTNVGLNKYLIGMFWILPLVTMGYVGKLSDEDESIEESTNSSSPVRELSIISGVLMLLIVAYIIYRNTTFANTENFSLTRAWTPARNFVRNPDFDNPEYLLPVEDSDVAQKLADEVARASRQRRNEIIKEDLAKELLLRREMDRLREKSDTVWEA